MVKDRDSGSAVEKFPGKAHSLNGPFQAVLFENFFKIWSQHFYSSALTYFKGESASSGSSFPHCSFALSIIQGAGANAYACS
jgi:hypothetical protein